MKKIKLTILLGIGIFLAPSFTQAQLVNIGSPIKAKQRDDRSKGVTADGKTVWCVYHTFDSINNANYLKIAKYNGLFWADYITLPARAGGAYSGRIPVQFYKNDLYFASSYLQITLASGNYNFISGLFKWDGVQVSLVTRFNTMNGWEYNAFQDMDTFKGELYVSGSFDSIGGVAYGHVAKYNGTTWSALGTTTQRNDVKLKGNQIVHNNNRLLLEGDSLIGNTTKYYGLASYDGTNLSPIDYSEFSVNTNPFNGFNRIMSHPDSSSYIYNESFPNKYVYSDNGKTPLEVIDSSSAYWTTTNHPFERFACNNGSIYTLQPGRITGPQNQQSPIIQKFTGPKLKRIYPPIHLWNSFFSILGTFGNNSVHFEFQDEQKGFKREFYRLDTNETLASTLSGRAYVDMNSNCMYDAGDKPISNQWIKLQNTGSLFNISVLTDKSGSYMIGGIPLGKDSISSSTANNKKLACGSKALQTINLTKDSNVTRDFIYNYDSTKKDLAVQAYSTWGSRVRRGFQDKYVVRIFNNSAFKRSGFVLVDVDSNFYDFYSTDPNITIIGKKVKFTFTNLGPDEQAQGYFYMRLPITVNLGSMVHINGVLDSLNIAWDNCPQNDSDYRKLRVRASCDPNDKTSDPEGDILPGTTDISYHINFQNVGNDTAYRVIIVDTIDTRLPLEKISIGGSSHPYTLRVVENILIFEFDNIYLVDSATNEEGSKGYIQFKAKLDPNLPLGARVNNRAHIYFDYNEAIETNIASVVVAQPSKVKKIKEEALKLYPNPAKQMVTVVNPIHTTTAYAIFNMMGQEVQNGPLAPGSNQINTAQLANGFYILKIKEQGTMAKFQILK